MPSLLDTLKGNKDKSKQTTIGPGGKLTQSSTVGTIQLAENLGQPVPTTPLSVAGLGANPDQAKMAGTPNQLKSANAVNLSGLGQTLSEYNQQGFKAGQASQDELNKQMQVKQLEQLGDLAPRVQQIINQSVQSAADQSLNAGLIAKKGLSPDLTEAVNAFAKGDKSKLPVIAKALGKDALAINYDDILNLYEDADASVIDNIIRQVPDSIKVSQTLLGDQVKLTDLSNTLGTDVSQLSIDQLNNELTKYFNAQQFGVEGLRAKAADPKTGSAERAAIYEQLRQMGASGEEAIAHRASELEQKVNSGLSVEFNGKTYSIDQLLADSNVSTLIKDYLTDPNSSSAQELAKLSPALIQFVNNNKQALSEAGSKLNSQATDVQTVIKTNRELGNTGVEPFNNDLLSEVLGPDWQNATELIDTSNLPVFNYLKDPKADPNKRAGLVANINRLYSLNPSVAKRAMELNPDQLEKSGLLLSPNHPDSAVNVYNLALGIKNNISKVDWSNPEEALEKLLGEDLPDGITSQVFNDYDFAKDLGLTGSDEGLDTLSDLRNVDKYANLDLTNLVDLKSKLGGRGLTDSANKIRKAAAGISDNPEITALRPFVSNDHVLDSFEASRLVGSMGDTKALNLFSKLKSGWKNGADRSKHIEDINTNLQMEASKAAGLDPISMYWIIREPSRGTEADINNLHKLSATFTEYFKNPEFNEQAKAALRGKHQQILAAIDSLTRIVNERKVVAEANNKKNAKDAAKNIKATTKKVQGR
jgi:hypothetical protein